MEEIKIIIDGREVTGQAGESILNIAARNGIEIPNLCYNKNLKVYGACGLCVVEAENSPKLLRSCATIAQNGQVIHTDTPRVKQARKIALELLMSDHEGDCKGPCGLNCPAHTDVQATTARPCASSRRKFPFPPPSAGSAPTPVRRTAAAVWWSSLCPLPI